jgi:hypothetical protein
VAQAEYRLVAAYLVELHHSLDGIHGDDAHEIVAEVADHLYEAADRHGELETLARFGTPNLVAATFHKEARKGAAVPTTFTKRAGLVAALSPLFLALGAWANEFTDRGFAHGAAVLFEVVAFPAVIVGILGLRSRHGGLGLLGRIGFWAFIAGPVFSIFMPWAGIAITGGLWALAFVLLGVAMLRAGVLPRTPVALFGFSAVAYALVAAAVSAAGADVGEGWVVPLVLQFAGFTWLGWAMWQEEVLATPGSGPWASAAA